MDGILLIDKPKGWTSFDVVAKVRSMLRQSQSPTAQQSNSQGLGDKETKGLSTHAPKVRVGHTGTLDPLATGLLVLVVGSYTKRAQEFSKLDKTYKVTMKLGQTSTTGDAEGIIKDYPYSTLSRKIGINVEEVESAIRSFVGEIEQVPPAFSAIKVGGQRAYKLAREGKEVKLEPRKVKIYEMTDVKYRYPEVKFTAKVSSGTYIRSLVEDIGQKLGTGAYMTDLCRTEVGKFSLDGALEVKELSQQVISEHLILL